MANLRILANNLADAASSLVADTTSGTLVAANLLTDLKGEVHRATATTVRYTLEWAAAKSFNMAALAFTNFSATATMRARVYTNTTDVVGVATPTGDSGAVLCCAFTRAEMWNWGTPGANAFAYGGFANARVYFAAASGRKLVIDVDDTGNAAGYVEAARVIAGSYWSPETNAVWGPSLSPKSGTQHKRTDAGDLRTERRPVFRTLRLDLGEITLAADRTTVYDILRGNGMSRPVFLSLFPENADAALEQAYQIWGRLDDTSMTNPSFGRFAAPLTVEEV
jgi:predicted GNAT family acetyltransferase